MHHAAIGLVIPVTRLKEIREILSNVKTDTPQEYPVGYYLLNELIY